MDLCLGFAGSRPQPVMNFTHLTHTIAHRVGRYLERQGLLVRDAENSYLTCGAEDDEPMNQLLGS